ncbi:MAG: lpxK [Herminiimonas sp.]|nr:lpxK [Herminiimonas sp.]
MQRGLAARLLFPLSLLFGSLAALRRALYLRGWLSSKRVAAPVIVVGNIFIGGTGKTPFVVWLVAALQNAGFAPGVISRGYGGSGASPTPLEVSETSLPEEVGDEPVLIAGAAKCPVAVGSDRAQVATFLLTMHPEVNVVISDDGLQHYGLSRDIEIVLFDERGVGNGWLLPAGPLREPAQRGRDFTVVNGPRMPEGLPSDAWRMLLVPCEVEQLRDCTRHCALSALTSQGMADLSGQAGSTGLTGASGVPSILAAAGIGNPARFFQTLEDAGLVFDRMALPDHHVFTAETFANVGADLILITEKDAVKCQYIAALKNDSRIWVVPVSAVVDQKLADRILEKLRGHPTA